MKLLLILHGILPTQPRNQYFVQQYEELYTPEKSFTIPTIPILLESTRLCNW